MSRLLTATVALITLAALAASAEAQPIDPYTISVLGPAPVYTDPNVDPGLVRTPRLSYPALTRELTDMVEFDPRFSIVTEEELQTTARSLQGEDVAEYVDYLRDRGIEEFSLYELDSAIDSLDTAVRSYAEAGATFTRPRDVALAYEYLARARLERANLETDLQRQTVELAAARHAFKQLIRLQPTAEIREGLFPAQVVQLFREAYIELLFDDGAGLSLSQTAARSFIERHHLDYLVNPYYIRDASGIRLVLQVFDSDSNEVFHHIVPLTTETATSRERVSRIFSRFVTCIPLRREPISAPEPVDANRLFMQAGWGFTFYGERPTDDQFLNQGVALLFDYHVSENFGVFGRSSVLFGERDADGDLLGGFTSIRTSGGVILSIRFSRLRIWLGTGIEFNHIGGFKATDDFWCKVSGGSVATYGTGRDCRSAEIAEVAPRNLFGPYLMPGLSVDIVRPFGFYVQGNFGFYLTNSVADIDFPLSGEGGIEYRF